MGYSPGDKGISAELGFFFKNQLFQIREQFIPMCREARNIVRRLAWRIKKLLKNKKEARDGKNKRWEQSQVAYKG